MRGSALAVMLAAVFVSAVAVPVRAAAFVVEPPPGWRDATADARRPGIVAALKGPETSSFVLAKAGQPPLDNPAAMRRYLTQVLDGVRRGSRRDFKTDGRVETRTFRNGLVAHLLRATLDGKPRLVVGVVEAPGGPLIATLNSAAPEAMLPSLVAGIASGRRAGEVRAEGEAVSLDGQLRVALGGGLRERALVEDERRRGFVLAIQGDGSELLFQRVEDATPSSLQADVVRETARAMPSMRPETVGAPREAPTAAGPAGVFAWGEGKDPADGRVAAGWLPWCYWGYSLFARGPGADDLLPGVLAAVKAGPRAEPKLLSATPRVPLAPRASRRRLLAAVGAACGLASLGLLGWSLRRKNPTVSP